MIRLTAWADSGSGGVSVCLAHESCAAFLQGFCRKPNGYKNEMTFSGSFRLKADHEQMGKGSLSYFHTAIKLL